MDATHHWPRLMHVVFIEPAFPRNQREFVRGLHKAGAMVTAIGESPLDALDDDLKGWLTHYEQAPSVVDEARLVELVRWIQERAPVDRLEATVEAHVTAAARVREVCGIPGTSVRTAFLCRDKPAMKEALSAAGVPCARSLGSGSVKEIREWALQVGFPLIVKPRAAAGAAGTHRVENMAGLEQVLHESGVDDGAEVAVEEFIEGHEAFYDTITIGGSVAHEFITHYYPNVLEAMRDRSISPMFITTNRVETAPAYQAVLELGRKVIDVLEIETSATHMEWFVGPKGLRFSEIGCRPPGVRSWDLYAAANDLDIYHEWGLAVTQGHTAVRASRSHSAGIIALRPDRDGVIAGYEGIDQVEREFGQWVIDAHLPPEGTPTQPVEAGYMANAWVRMKHPDYDELHRMMDVVGQTVRVRAR